MNHKKCLELFTAHTDKIFADVPPEQLFEENLTEDDYGNACERTYIVHDGKSGFTTTADLCLYPSGDGVFHIETTSVWEMVSEEA